jgi:adenylate cyclase
MVLTNHTFLFADLVGFTAFTAAEGDERATRMALTFHERVRAELEAHAAVEIKTMGDGVMLRCDCPLLALRLAVRIVEEIGGSDGLLPIRAGVSTGPAIGADGDWYGATVNLAARLCDAAREGETLTCETTHATAHGLDGVELTGQGRLALKNLPAPVPAFAARAKATDGAWRSHLTRAFPQPAPVPHAAPA